MLFRKKFTLDAVTATTIFITADDYYKLYINGQFVGQGPAPCLPIRHYFNEMDITPFLQKGENTIAVHTYYQGLINRVWTSGDNRHGLLFDIVADGKTIVSSDESVKQCLHHAFTACGIVGYDTQFMERYDANAPEVGFEQPDFDDSRWQPAVLNTKADYTLQGCVADSTFRGPSPVTPGLTGSLPAPNVILSAAKDPDSSVATLPQNDIPAPGSSVDVTAWGRTIRWWRMPSTSRAYPLPLSAKAATYALLWQ